jgi:hypothetical protein
MHGYNLMPKPDRRCTWGHARKHAKSAHQNRLLLIGSRIRVWVLLRNKHNQPTLNSSLAPGETWMAKRINLYTYTEPELTIDWHWVGQKALLALFIGPNQWLIKSTPRRRRRPRARRRILFFSRSRDYLARHKSVFLACEDPCVRRV